MRQFNVRVYDLAATPPQEEQLAWVLAECAADKSPVDPKALEMAACRVIDNSAVAMAAINVGSVAAARAEALAHPRDNGAALYGLSPSVAVHCEWAAWANATAVRELDFHDSFFGADVAHTGDTMSGIIAVAQQMGCSGKALAKGILTAYEIHIALAHNIPLAASKLDHPGHIVPAVVCGAGAMLDLSTDTIFQAVQHGVHVSATTGQARRGEITSWKANAPGHVSMLAIHALDRAMRGERSPGPIYEGDHGFLAAYVKENPDGYMVNLPEVGEPKRMILQTYTKEHAAGYHGQVPIDLAFKMRSQLNRLDEIESVVLKTKWKTHMMMGAGAGDKTKWDPKASRETLDHSAMYCFAVALKTALGTTKKVICRSARSVPIQWRFGEKSQPLRMPNGRAAMMSPHHWKRIMVCALLSPIGTALLLKMKWRSRMLTHAALDHLAPRSMSKSSVHSPIRLLKKTRLTVSSILLILWAI